MLTPIEPEFGANSDPIRGESLLGVRVRSSLPPAALPAQAANDTLLPRDGTN
jgi:hypothetical protein